MDTAPRAGQKNTRADTSTWVFFCLATLLTLAPLMRGGNRQLAIGLLLAIGLITLASLITHKLSTSHSTRHPASNRPKVWGRCNRLARHQPTLAGHAATVPRTR